MCFTKLLTVSEVGLKFLKFATNLAISFCSCQSIVNVNFTLNFVGKLSSSLREKFAPFGEIVSEFPYTLWSRRLGITSFTMSYKTLQLNFPRCHPTPT